MLGENSIDECKEKYLDDHNDSLDKTDRSGEDDQDSEKKKQKLLKLLEERLQYILKSMIKLAMAKTSKLVCPVINYYVYSCQCFTLGFGFFFCPKV